MKKIILLTIIFSFNTNIIGQKRWAIGVSGSVDKLIDHMANENMRYQKTNYTLKYGSSINLILQHEFNKHWFIRTGIDYFSYSYSYQINYPTGSYILPNNNQIGGSNAVVLNTSTIYYFKYTDGYVEIPFSVGYQLPFSSSPFKLNISLGTSFSKLIYVDSHDNINASTNNGFYFGYSYATVNLLSTIGISYSFTPNFLILGGFNLRQGISGEQYGSVGLQLGILYYIGKPLEGKKTM